GDGGDLRRRLAGSVDHLGQPLAAFPVGVDGGEAEIGKAGVRAAGIRAAGIRAARHAPPPAGLICSSEFMLPLRKPARSIALNVKPAARICPSMASRWPIAAAI